MVELVKTRVATLADVAEFIRGITFKPNDIEDGPTDTNIDCLRTKNVQASLDTRDVWAIDPSFVKRPNQYVTEGDILISSANSWNLVGKCSWIPRLARPTAFGGFVTVLRRRDDSIDSRYLFRWFSSDRVQRTIRSFGNQTTNISNLDLKRSASLTLPLPPLDEQRRIAAILDKADDLRIKRRQAVAHLDALTHSIFHSMFGDPISNPMGWPMARVGDALESAKYGSSEKAALVGTTPVLRMNNLTYGGQLDLSQMKYLSGDVDEKYLVRSGDVLFNRTNSAELVGKTAVYTGPEPMAYAGYLVRLRTNASCRPHFLGTFMNLPSTKKTLRNMCKSIVGMANINAQEVQTIKMPLPHVEKQNAFEARLVAISHLKDHHHAQLRELDTLFASLQHRAFKGEL